MPEGDTLYAAQERLRPILVGQQVELFWARRLRGIPPRRDMSIVAVDAVGKHLLIAFERGLVLQTHLGMSGSWRTLAHDTDLDAFAANNPKARILIKTSVGIAVCFAAPTITTFVRPSDPNLDANPNLPVGPTSHLGPNLTAQDLRLEEITSRLAQFHSHSSLLVDVLLDQRIAAGIGNVYKSEVLHLHRLGPNDTLSDLVEPTALFVTAHSLLQRNIAAPHTRRTTTPKGATGPRYWVYGRHRLPCLSCGTPIERTYNGKYQRSTYWCPSCQPQRGRPSHGRRTKPAALPSSGAT